MVDQHSPSTRPSGSSRDTHVEPRYEHVRRLIEAAIWSLFTADVQLAPEREDTALLQKSTLPPHRRQPG